MIDTMEKKSFRLLHNFASEQLENVILPFWKKYTVDSSFGGFYGQVNDDLNIEANADKGLVLNARILWTFSAAYGTTGDPEDLKMANRAYAFLQDYFFDKENRGYYWSLTYDGKIKDSKKQIYAQSFVMYGMTEYYKITKNQAALNQAIELFNLIEKYSFDTKRNGYIEACTHDWEEIEDLRLSKKDMNEKKSQNTHLHILEAYTNLYTVWKDSLLKVKLENLIHVFTTYIIHPDDSHLILFFDEEWNPKSSIISYGHDIECSWLLHEAARVTGNEKLIKAIETVSIEIAKAASEGYIDVGALLYEDDREGKHKEEDLEWWVQAEAVVGFLNSYEITQDRVYLEKACAVVSFIDKHLVDKENGEWYFRLDRNGHPLRTYEKAGFWKCPYHNTRTCLELLHRIDPLNI